MEIPLIILLLVLVLVVFPLWAIIRIVSLGSKNESLDRKLDLLEEELKRLRQARPEVGLALRAGLSSSAPQTQAGSESQPHLEPPPPLPPIATPQVALEV